MAFTATQLGTLQEILEISSFDLDIVLDRVTITSAVETLIIADITLWATYRDNFVSIEPKERNFGARINTNGNRDAIRRRIMNWLDMPMEAGATGLIRA